MRFPIWRGASLATVLAAAPLIAQDPTTAADDIDLWVRAPGPAGLLAAFADTNLGRALSGPQMEPAREAIRNGWAEFRATLADDGVDLAPIVETLLEHSGAITVAFRADAAALRAAIEQEDPVAAFRALSLVVRLADDGSADLDAVATKAVELVEDAGVPLVPVGGIDGGLAQIDPEGPGILMPTRVGDELVLVFAAGDGFEARVAELLAAPRVPTGGDDAAPFEVFVSRELTGLLGELPFLAEFEPDTGGWQAAVGSEDVEPTPDEDLGAAAARTALSLDNPPEVSIRAFPVDEHVRVDMVLTTDAARPSLLSLLESPNAGPLDLLRLVPRDQAVFTSFFFDFAGAFQRALGFGAESGAFAAEDVEGTFTEATGFDLRADLLGRLTGELVLVNEAQETLDEFDEDAPEPELLPGMYSFVVGVRDATGFADMVDKLLRKQGLHAARKRAEYRGVELFTLNVLGFLSIEYGFVDGAMLLGVGEVGARTVRRIVDRSLDGAAAKTAWAPGVAERVAALPAGWQALSVSTTLFSPEEMLDLTMSEFEDDPDFDDGGPGAAFREAAVTVFGAFFQALQTNDLKTQVSSLACRDGVLRATQIW